MRLGADVIKQDHLTRSTSLGSGDKKTFDPWAVIIGFGANESEFRSSRKKKYDREKREKRITLA